MKKILIILCIAVLCLTLLVACGGQNAPEVESGSSEVTTAAEDTTTEKAGSTTKKTEVTDAPAGNQEPNTALVDDRTNGNGAKPDNFTD